MDALDHEPLREIVERLVKAYEPERIYLFGSAARGDRTGHNDYDLLILVSDDAPPERCRSTLAYRVLRGTGVAVDPIVWTSGAFQSRVRVPTSLAAIVEREGKVVYSAESRERTGTGDWDAGSPHQNT